MKRTILAAALALALAPAAFAQSNSEGELLVRQGQAAFQTGNYAAAAQYLWDATMADEAVRDSAPLQTLRGRAVMRTGRPENAIRIFDLIGGSAEDYADAMYWRGEALMMMTEPGEAADSFRLALQFDPDHVLAQQRLSGLPAGLTAPTAVQAPLIDSAPVDEIAVQRTAPARERTAADNQPAPAPMPAPAPAPAPVVEEDAGEPVSLRPAPTAAPPAPPPAAPEPQPQAAAIALPDSELERGRAAYEAGAYADAAALLWRATQADPAVRGDAQVQVLRGRAVMQSGRPEAAIAVFDMVADEFDGRPAADALYWRGEALNTLGREAEAEQSWRAAMEEQSGYAPARARLAELAPPAPPPEGAAQPEPEPQPVVAEAAPPAPEPVPAPAPAAPPAPPAQSAAGEAAPTPEELDAAAQLHRAQASDARRAGDTAAESDALRELYLTQRATPAEIARYAELADGTVSADIGRDFQIAQLATIGGHTALSLALFRAVEAAGEVSGNNLAILRTNIATALLSSGDAQGALDKANEAIDANEEYANAWGVRSLAKQELGDLGGALEDAKYAYDRGVQAPPVLALLNAAGFAVEVPPQPQDMAPPAGDPAPLRGAQN